MKTSTKSARCKKNPPAWHARFEAMIPMIEAHAKIVFRRLDPEAREEAVQETICNACCAYARLAERGRTDVAYPSALARFGVRQTIVGRKVGSKLNVRDVSSPYCRSRKGVVVERLDKYDVEEGCWKDVVVEDRRVGPAEVAATRIDFSAWLQRLPSRLRKIATFLANGETATAASKRFGVSQGRISQLRGELFLAWRRFQGDGAAVAVA
jgi:hypothetical protein